MKTLDLPLKAKWYDMIESGEKKEEYREIKPFWYQRLYQRKKEYSCAGKLSKSDAEYVCLPEHRHILLDNGFKDNEFRPYTHVRFRYGYTKRTMLYEIESISIGKGNPDWGAPNEEVFIIKLGKMINSRENGYYK